MCVCVCVPCNSISRKKLGCRTKLGFWPNPKEEIEYGQLWVFREKLPSPNPSKPVIALPDPKHRARNISNKSTSYYKKNSPLSNGFPARIKTTFWCISLQGIQAWALARRQERWSPCASIRRHHRPLLELMAEKSQWLMLWSKNCWGPIWGPWFFGVSSWVQNSDHFATCHLRT